MVHASKTTDLMDTFYSESHRHVGF